MLWHFISWFRLAWSFSVRHSAKMLLLLYRKCYLSYASHATMLYCAHIYVALWQCNLSWNRMYGRLIANIPTDLTMSWQSGEKWFSPKKPSHSKNIEKSLLKRIVKYAAHTHNVNRFEIRFVAFCALLFGHHFSFFDASFTLFRFISLLFWSIVIVGAGIKQITPSAALLDMFE